MLLDSLEKNVDFITALVALLPHVVDAQHACPLIELNCTPAQRLTVQTLMRQM
jgi:hypothetical protein